MSNIFNNREFQRFRETQNKPTRNQLILKRLEELCDEDPDLTFHFETTRGTYVKCEKCLNIWDKIDDNTKGNIDKHIKTSAHQKKELKSKENTPNDQKSSQTQFQSALTIACICAVIPLVKIDNDVLHNFLETYCDRKVPSASNLYKKYVNDTYKDLLKRVQDLFKDSKIYIIIDETSDYLQRTVFHLLVGKLDGKPSTPCLISTQYLENTEHPTICDAITTGLNKLWPDGIRYENVLLCLSDQARNMLSTGTKSKSDFPNMRHITCLIHCIQRVCEKVRDENELCDRFISEMKCLLNKSGKRKREFQKKTGLPLPKHPVLTRWGTWLRTSFYYAEHFAKVQEFIKELMKEPNRPRALIQLDEMIDDPQLPLKLNNLKYFKILVDKIEELSIRGKSLRSQLDCIQFLRENLSDYSLEKLEFSLSNNPDFKSIETENRREFDFAPLTTIDVERSFSAFGNIVTDKRLSLSEENIEKYVFMHYNQFMY